MSCEKWRLSQKLLVRSIACQTRDNPSIGWGVPHPLRAEGVREPAVRPQHVRLRRGEYRLARSAASDNSRRMSLRSAMDSAE
jgi:hypothetical protein